MNQKSLVYGVGINDVPSSTTEYGRSPFYYAWKSMLERCHSERYLNLNPSYRGCSVSDEWVLFSNFKEWMKGHKWEGMVLDKDLLFPGNKVYSAETCLFVPVWVNSLLANLSSKRRSLPMGVVAVGNRFRARYKISGRTLNLGAHDTPEAAHLAFRVRRLSYLELNAKRYSSEPDANPAVSDALARLCIREAESIETLRS